MGTISSCPRCGSMVQIVLPITTEVPRQLVAGAGVDSDAITEEAVAAEVLADQPIGKGGFDTSGVGEPTRETTTGSATEALPTNWESESSQRKRHLAQVVALAGSGLLVAAISFGWFVKNWTANRENRIRQAAADLTPPDNASPSNSASALDVATAQDSDVMDAVATPPDDATSATPTSSEPTTDSVAPLDGILAPPQQGSDETSSTAPPALFEPWAMANDSDGPAAISSRDLPVDGGNTDASDERGRMKELPAELAEFTKLLDLASSNFELKPTLATPTTIRDMKLDAPAEEEIDPMMIANPPEPISLKKALAIRMALDSPGYPLPDLLLVFSQITGVPIHIDWTSFDIAGRDVSQTMSAPSGWMQAGELLDALAASIDAEARKEDSLIQITLSDSTFNAAYDSIANLNDFGDGRQSAALRLVRFLQRPGDESPEKKLAGVATREDKQLAALAFETLRRMRAIKPQMSEDRYSRWATSLKTTITDDTAAGTWPLLKDIRPIEQLDAPETIAAVLRRTARLNQATCLINAYDTRRRRLSPEQLVMPFSGQSGEAMLAKTLAPFRLQVRQVDSAHWWVGTEATYDRLPVLVWTEPLGANRNEFESRFGLVANEQGDGNMRLVVDDESDRAMMLIPRFLARQLKSLLP